MVDCEHVWGPTPPSARFVETICEKCGAIKIYGFVFTKDHPQYWWLLADTNRNEKGEVI